MKDLGSLLKELIKNDEKYNQINKEISDDFVSDYYWLSDSRINHDSLAGLGLRFHEKWEIRESLRLGVPEEELRRLGSYANTEIYDIAHGRASYEEQLFYQRIGEKILGYKIPIPALKLVRDSLTMQGKLSTIFYDFEEYNELVKSEKFLKEDVIHAIDLFEKTGWEFKNKDNIFEYFDYLFQKTIKQNLPFS